MQGWGDMLDGWQTTLSGKIIQRDWTLPCLSRSLGTPFRVFGAGAFSSLPFQDQKHKRDTPASSDSSSGTVETDKG